MRKMWAVLLLAACFLLAACGGEPADVGDTTTTIVTTVTDTPSLTTTAEAEASATTVPSTTAKKTTKSKKTKKTTVANDMTTVATEPNVTVIAPTTAVTSCVHEDVEKATCTQGEACKRCGVVINPPLGHDFVDGACARCGAKSPEQLNRVEVLGISLQEAQLSLLVGDSVTLKHSLVPSNATDKDVTFESSNPAAVTVSSSGVVTAVAVGDAVITVTSMNGKSASCRVAVRDVALGLPPLPQMFRFYAEGSEDAAGSVEITGTEYFYTQLTETDGTLLIVFRGFVQYSEGVSSVAPQVQWKLYNANDEEVASGTAEGQPSIGGGSVSMSFQVNELAPGRYRLEIGE